MTHSTQPNRALARLRSFIMAKARTQHGHKGWEGGAQARSYLVSPGQPVWMERDYARFAQEAYMRNVIAHRAIAMVASAAASVRVKLFTVARSGVATEMPAHPMLDVLAQPNPAQARQAFFESMYQYRLISGNAFVLAGGPQSGKPQELYTLRPDRVSIIAGKNGVPAAYRYTAGAVVQD